MPKYSVYIRESLTGVSATVPGRDVADLSSKYFEFDESHELNHRITEIVEQSNYIVRACDNGKLLYRLEINQA